MTMMALLLTMAMGMQAQSLLGTWKSNTTTDEDGDKTAWTFIFGQGSKFTLKLTMETSDPEVGDLAFGLTMPGTYKKNGNTLTLTIDAKQAKGKMEKTIYKGEMADLIKDSPEMKKTIDEMLQKQIDEELKKNFKDEAPFDGDLTIKSLTSTKLVLEDEDETIELFKQ